MKDRNEFDELARRKLEERVFAFDEAHWTAVEGALNAERKRSRRGLWIFSIAALFIAAGLLWWNVGDRPAAVVAEQRTAGQNIATVESNDDRPASPPTVTASLTPAPTTNGGSTSATASQEAKTISPAQPSSQPTTRTNKLEHSTDPAASMPQQARKAASSATTTEPPMDVQVHSSDPVAVVASAAHLPESIAAPSPGESGGASPASTTVAGDVTGGTSPTPQDNESTIAVSAPTPEPSTGVVAANEPAPTDPAHDHTTTTAATASATGPDTTTTPSQIPRTSPGRWELSALVGRFSTQSQYTWNGELDPAVDVQRGSSTSYAAELMNMGAHVGFGFGLHLSEYAERIDARELSTSHQFQSTHYFILPVDTTILVIIDTIVIDGTTHYVTGQLDTTFNILGSEQVTNTVTEQQREARQLVNRVSYVEIPLLADAHVRSGHWNLGVRGGPTIGFLSASRGALPNATGDGYVDLGRDHLQATVFGYTARAYVRYALNEAWALGLEPTIKGQITSTLPKGDAVRKGSALGAFFSVTYRLP